jgi:hypothetical protein
MIEILLNPFVLGILIGCIVFIVLTYLDNGKGDDDDNKGSNKENIILVSGIVAILVGFIKYYFFKEIEEDNLCDTVDIITGPLDLPDNMIPEVFFKVEK